MKQLLFCLALICVLLLSILATAQVQNGQINGLVTDPSGAAIPNAKVTIKNVGTDLTFNTTTNQQGLYSARELPVGQYRVTVEAPNFKTSTTTAQLNAGMIQHVDMKMTLGQAKEVVEVTGAAAPVDTEDSKLSATVGSTQIANLPLNGRNIYDLIQLSPGAVRTNTTIFEGGQGNNSPASNIPVVNGVRQNFNGFLINGVSNKQLSGGPVNQPIEDTVQEFQQLTLNMSAQYGNSAGSITNLVTKSGTNALHGSAWEFVRNDFFDANNFFLNQAGVKNPPLRYNQFGGTIGGPIIKDKLFFFGSYQGDRFRTSGQPATVSVESPQWRQAVQAAYPTSVASLLYSNFQPTIPGTPSLTLAQYVAKGLSGSGFTSFSQFLCPGAATGVYGGSRTIPMALAKIIGYNHLTDNAGCSNPLSMFGFPDTVGTMDRNAPFQMDTVAIFGTQVKDNLFNGNETSFRLDYNMNDKNRFFGQFNWYRNTDSFGPGNPNLSQARGTNFLNPTRNTFPNGQLSWVHTFNPAVLNELRLGYSGTIGPIIKTAVPGVPQVNFDDGSMGFGSYSGYPQNFKENVYTYSDMVSISHGKHNMKVGADFRRNLENSEFNVARSSYYFFDPLFFGVDTPVSQVAGVDPGILTNRAPQLASNIRHWRNLEVGAYFQDDWKVTHNLTLNLGLRWDLFTRHTEKDNLVTTFIPGPGNNIVDQVINANVPATTVGTINGQTFNCTSPAAIATAQLAPPLGSCGPGGFATASSLGKGNHHNFGPRVGFAWDMFGDGKSSLRGGYGMSYEGTLYNPLSNSRWNLPFYSFNEADSPLIGGASTIIYGPANSGCPACTVAPRFTGTATNPGQGTGAQANGNLTGWAPNNANLAFLTGIVLPSGIRDPYVHNWFFGFQRELFAKTVLEVNYVGTAGHDLFRSEDINRLPGGGLPVGTCITDNLGRQLCGLQDPVINPSGVPNPNYGKLRQWKNAVNSIYNGLQLSLRKQVTHGFQLTANYTYSHSIDGGSTWHSGATSANGAAAGEGYTTDVTQPNIDRGNSIFDIRHRFVLDYVWELPGQHLSSGVARAIIGGWQLNGIWSYQTGAHWSPFNADPALLDCSTGTCINTGGDYNLDHGRNDRPNSSIPGFSGATNTMWANGFGPQFTIDGPGSFLTTPCVGCTGTLGRNTFVGPSYFNTDMSMFKNFNLTERWKLQFRSEFFNVFNHTNFLLPGAAGAHHNRVTDGNFGEAGGAFNPRQMQFGLKLSF